MDKQQKQQKQQKQRVPFGEHVPEAGAQIVDGGQIYEVVRAWPHLNLDGSRTSSIVWRTRCAHSDCGMFEFRSGGRAWHLPRRCEAHRNVGGAPRQRGESAFRAWLETSMKASRGDRKAALREVLEAFDLFA